MKARWEDTGHGVLRLWVGRDVVGRVYTENLACTIDARPVRTRAKTLDGAKREAERLVLRWLTREEKRAGQRTCAVEVLVMQQGGKR